MSHVTGTPLSRSKGQRSRSPGRFTHRHVNASGSCSGERGNVLTVGNYCYVAVCSAARGASAPTEGEVWGHIVAAARLQLVIIIIIISSSSSSSLSLSYLLFPVVHFSSFPVSPCLTTYVAPTEWTGRVVNEMMTVTFQHWPRVACTEYLPA